MKNFDGFNDSETWLILPAQDGEEAIWNAAGLLPLFPMTRTTLYLARLNKLTRVPPLWNHPKTVARAFASDESLPSRDRWVK
jgi:hypothetical protein